MYSLLNDTRICQVCQKLFPNGKALGGHMRSHTRTHKLSGLSRKSQRGSKSATSSTVPPLQISNVDPPVANIKPNETVLVRSVHISEAVVGPKPDLREEGGQETSTGKRKFLWDLNEVYPTESQSSLTDQEEAVSLLLNLSEVSNKPENAQDAKPCDFSVSIRKGKEIVEYIEIVDSEEEDEENYYRYLDGDDENNDENAKILTSEVKKENDVVGAGDKDENEDDDDELYLVPKENKRKKKYKCDLCGKVLRSYQALGGHRTSHRNKRLKMLMETNDEASNPQNEAVVRRNFSCEFCDKVFTSGQALGGHKKIHYMYLKPCNIVAA